MYFRLVSRTRVCVLQQTLLFGEVILNIKVIKILSQANILKARASLFGGKKREEVFSFFLFAIRVFAFVCILFFPFI